MGEKKMPIKSCFNFVKGSEFLTFQNSRIKEFDVQSPVVQLRYSEFNTSRHPVPLYVTG
jgi:hypothetical protein